MSNEMWNDINKLINAEPKVKDDADIFRESMQVVVTLVEDLEKRGWSHDQATKFVVEIIRATGGE